MKKKKKNTPLAYIGLTTQWLIGIGLSLYAGHLADDYFELRTPVAIWLLPLLFIMVSLYKLIRQTGK
jgi:hypothetical protein